MPPPNDAEKYGLEDGQTIRRTYKGDDYVLHISVGLDRTTTYELGGRTFQSLRDAAYSIVGEEKRRTWNLDGAQWWKLRTYEYPKR